MSKRASASICCPRAAPEKQNGANQMVRIRLTDRSLKALRPAEPGKRYDVMDAEAPGLGVRVTDKGHLSFIYAARFPGSANFTRREISHVRTLDEAREV